MSSHEPVWTPHPAPSVPDRLPDRVQVVVIGAGIAGLSTAVQLGRAGVETLLATAEVVGGGVTGRSNSKVTALHQMIYADLVDRHGIETARAYVEANTDALAWLRDLAGDVWQPRDAVTVARDVDEREQLGSEIDAAQRAGLDVLDSASDDWPDPHRGMRLSGQGQVDPVALALRMRDRLGETVTVAEHTRATGLHPAPGGRIVRFGDRSVRAAHVVVATGMPVFDRGGYFALCEPESSYLVAMRHPGEGGDMMITVGDPKVSIRWVEGATPDDRLVLVGGQPHRTGAGGLTSQRYTALEAWARDNLDGVGEVVARWSAMDYMSPDRLPFAGPLNRVGDGSFVITGMSKWGFTLGAACAATVSRAILGEEPTAFDRAVHPRRLPDLSGVKSVVQSNAQVGTHMTGGWAGAVLKRLPDELAEGDGVVGRKGIDVVASCRVDGERHDNRAVCPHLGGIVTWNDGDRTWDCPLHGSRFDHDGAVRHGPANRPLG
ncbi:MAG: FAD-dependent oxidoreductase [Actinomycetota bacterium]